MSLLPHDNTFQTDFDHTSSTTSILELVLPPSVNIVAVRETVLAEAPFITKSNKSFWKKWLNSPSLSSILAAVVIGVSDAISENSTFNAAALTNIRRKHNKPMLNQISLNIAKLLLDSRSKHGNSQDTLFRKLPEIICFMAINSLQSCLPKHIRLLNTNRFRLILLDFICEIVTGIQISDVKKDTEWIFADATDNPVVIVGERKFTNTNVKKITNTTTIADNNGHDLENGDDESTDEKSEDDNKNKLNNLSSAVSRITLEHSPAMSNYFQMKKEENKPHLCQNAITLRMTHSHLRPLNTMRPELFVVQGKFREKKINNDDLKATIKRTKSFQKEINQNFEIKKKELSSDIFKIRKSLTVQMSLLNNETVSNKDLLLAVKTQKSI